MKALLLILPLLLWGCNLKEINFLGSFANQGVIGKGNNTGNTMGMSVDLDQMDIAGDRDLTEEEKKIATEGYKKGFNMAREAGTSYYTGVKLHYVSKFRDDVPRETILEIYPKLKKVHKDTATLIWRMHTIDKRFVLTECKRSLDRQKKLKAKGRSWTLRSYHLKDPAQACDILPVRKGKPDWNDVEGLSMFQGMAYGLNESLKNYPCNEFASRVEFTMQWKKIRDLYHIETRIRKECLPPKT